MKPSRNAPVKQVIRFLRSRMYPAGRKVTVFPDDVYLTSYPRSGNTWMRFLISNLLWKNDLTTFRNIDSRIPDIYKETDHKLQQYPRPRYLKSHEYYDPRYPKVLYIVRDVRSVVLSYYYFFLRNGRLDSTKSMKEFSEEILAGGYNPYGSWMDNVLSWTRIAQGNEGKILVVRYEDLKSNPSPQVERIAHFLGLDVTDGDIKRAIENSSFERMSKLEKRANNNWTGNVSGKGENISFIRQGSDIEWQEAFDSETKQLIYDQCAAVLSELGYEG